jgi:hypothetical protein
VPKETCLVSKETYLVSCVPGHDPPSTHSPVGMVFQNMIVDTMNILYAYVYAYRVPNSYDARCTHLPLICRTSVRVSVIHRAMAAS